MKSVFLSLVKHPAVRGFASGALASLVMLLLFWGGTWLLHVLPWPKVTP